MKNRTLLILFVSAFFLFACKSKRKKGAAQRDSSITQTTSFNNLFFDSTYIDEFIEKNPQYEPYAEQLDDFYRHRNFEFAWFDSKGLAEQVHNFMNLQDNYISEFQDSSIANPELSRLHDSLDQKVFKPNNQDSIILKTELLLTAQFFRYAAKVYKGSDIDAAKLGWFIPRKKIDLSAMLKASLSSKTIDPEQYAPQNNQYKKLQEWLGKYIEMQKRESNDSIPYVAKKALKKGDSSQAVVLIKKRLQLLGDLPVKDSSSLFDSSLVLATISFQKRMGLASDGVVGNKMIAELNVPLSKRIRQLLINIERIRWMPAERDSNYILVNIPEFKMHVYDSAKQLFEMNVIVGSAANNSVIFTGNLKYIVFSPYWNVPESIVKKEVLPSMEKNHNYLSKNNMEITGYSGKTPIVRQKPGPANSLGLVKFLFPNNYNIYLHDTPNRELFSQSSRNLSHGCIRLGDAKKFATYLLRSDTSWNSKSIDDAMHLAKEKWVTLKKTVPVFLVYFTAWVNDNGELNFRKDIYGHDEKMSEKLFDK
jgi:murein L,D-transpeptidase YcbB/YkuD